MSVRRSTCFVIVFCLLLASVFDDVTLDAGGSAYQSTLVEVTTSADAGPGSLRAAVDAAESGATITFAPALAGATITLSTAGEIGTALVVRRDVTIDGGTIGVTIARDTTDYLLNLRLFRVERGITVRMRNLTLMNGLASGGNGTGRAGGGAGFGGAIYNGGALLLENMTFSENWAVGGTSVSGGSGVGGFPNGGTLCNVAGFGGGSARNPSCGSTPGFGGGGGGSSLGGGGAGMGGAVFNDNGSLVIVNSTFSANHAQGGEPGGSNGLGGAGLGGALFSLNDTMAIVNSTFVGNTVSAFQVGPGDLTNGGGIYALGFERSASITLNNTIVAGSSPGAEALYTAFVGGGSVSSSGAKNIIETIGGLGFAGEWVSVDPLLGPLAMNGGPTPTHRPLPGSPATNAGHYDLAVFPDGQPIATDQRGYPRMGSFQVDIGAYESQPPTIDLPIVFITAGTTQTGVLLAQVGDVDGPGPVTPPIFSLQSGGGVAISNVAMSAEGRITGTVQALCGAVGSNFIVELQDAEGNVAQAGLQVRLNGVLSLVAVPEPFTQTRQLQRSDCADRARSDCAGRARIRHHADDGLHLQWRRGPTGAACGVDAVANHQQRRADAGSQRLGGHRHSGSARHLHHHLQRRQRLRHQAGAGCADGDAGGRARRVHRPGHSVDGQRDQRRVQHDALGDGARHHRRRSRGVRAGA